MAEHNDFGKLAEEQAVIFFKAKSLSDFSPKLVLAKIGNRYYCRKGNIIHIVK